MGSTEPSGKMNMLDYEFVKWQEKGEVPDMFSRKNSFLGIGVNLFNRGQKIWMGDSQQHPQIVTKNSP